ncbi:MAG: DUF4261 domain-containing protein [Planctomycetota bacterium]
MSQRDAADDPAEDDEGEETPRMAMLCLPTEGGGLDLDAIAAAYRERYPDAEPLALEGAEGAALGTLGEDRVVLTHVGAAIPWTDLEGPCSTAWYWEEAAEVVRAHRGHLICALLAGAPDGEVERTLRLTRLVAAAVAAGEASAVFWCEAPLVQARDAFLEMTEHLSREEFPLELWVELRPLVDPDTGNSSVLTSGMSALGLMELEVRESKKTDSTEVLDIVYGIARHLIDSGMVIGDGDTLDFGDVKIRARYDASAWPGREGPVLVLEVP